MASESSMIAWGVGLAANKSMPRVIEVDADSATLKVFSTTADRDARSSFRSDRSAGSTDVGVRSRRGCTELC